VTTSGVSGSTALWILFFVLGNLYKYVYFLSQILNGTRDISKDFASRIVDKLFSTEEEKEYLRPNLLISFGGPMVSKNLKLFLRNYKPDSHWHIGACGNFVYRPGHDGHSQWHSNKEAK
jgi:2-succinyl-5-enolpyruvyl-6-hydroxy-3-cyclohexene-1-carboxylate synthase